MVHQTCAGKRTSITPTLPSIISAAATGPTTIAAQPFPQTKKVSTPRTRDDKPHGRAETRLKRKKEIHAFDATEEEGGAEGEDHVRDAQRVLHRRHGLRVVVRHPRLHRAHRSAVAAAAEGRPAAAQYWPAHAAGQEQRTGPVTPARIKNSCRDGNFLLLLQGGRRAQGQRTEQEKKQRKRSSLLSRGNLRPVPARQKTRQRLA